MVYALYIYCSAIKQALDFMKYLDLFACLESQSCMKVLGVLHVHRASVLYIHIRSDASQGHLCICRKCTG